MIVPSTSMAEALERRLNVDQQGEVDQALCRVRPVADANVPPDVGWPVVEGESRVVRVVATERYEDASGDTGDVGSVVMGYTGAGPHGRVVQLHTENRAGAILAAVVLDPEETIRLAYDLIVVAQHALTDAVIA